MKVRNAFLVTLPFVSLILGAAQEQFQRPQGWYEWAKSYVAPRSIPGAGTGSIGMLTGAGLGTAVYRLSGTGSLWDTSRAALGSASLPSVPFFALTNLLKGGREYLSSSYWPAYLAYLAMLSGLYAAEVKGMKNLPVDYMIRTGLYGSAPLLIVGHRLELKKKAQKAQELLDKINNNIQNPNLSTFDVDKLYEEAELIDQFPKVEEPFQAGQQQTESGKVITSLIRLKDKLIKWANELGIKLEDTIKESQANIKKAT